MKTSSFVLAALVSLCFAGHALAAGPSSAAVSDEARKHFKAGVAFLQDPDGARYEEAYREFKEAYRISPSWKILGNLGLAALKLERNGEAIDAYEKYLAEGGKDIDPGERSQVERDLLALKASSTALQLSAKDAGGDVALTDQRARTTGGAIVNTYTIPADKPLSIRVQAGHHVFVARSSKGESRWETDLGDHPAEHTFAFETQAAPAQTAAPTAATTAATVAPPPPEPKTPPLRTVGWIGVGVGGAMIVGGVVTGLMAKGKFSDLESACPDKTHCPTANKSTADSANSLATVTNVLWIGGAVVAAAGGAMVILGKPSDANGGGSARLVVSPSGGPGALGLSAHGAF